jgi:hypothetical protein
MTDQASSIHETLDWVSGIILRERVIYAGFGYPESV